jgi:hypothetical protein
MNGNVFECFYEQSDKRQYAKIIEGLREYAKRTFRFPKDFASLFAPEASEPVAEKPVDLPPGHSTTDEMIWTEKMKAYVDRVRVLRGNMAAFLPLPWGCAARP